MVGLIGPEVGDVGATDLTILTSGGMNGGVRSPENWVGFFTFKAIGRPTIAATGTATCQFYGRGNQPGTNLASVFFYDPDTDMVESSLDGTLFSRSTSDPGIPTDEANPLVGSWEGTDGDLTHVEMSILADGSWESTDTRSAGCERKGVHLRHLVGGGLRDVQSHGHPLFRRLADHVLSPGWRGETGPLAGRQPHLLLPAVNGHDREESDPLSGHVGCRRITLSNNEDDQMTEDYPPILDAAQVAELLGMNVQMVRRYAREGRLPAYKLPGGRTFKFFRDEIYDFVRSHPVAAESDRVTGDG